MQDCSAAKNEVKIKKEKVELTVFSRTRHARFLWYTGEHWKEKGWLTLDSVKVRHFYHRHGEPVAKGKLLFRCVWCVFVYDTTQTGKKPFLSKSTAERQLELDWGQRESETRRGLQPKSSLTSRPGGPSRSPHFLSSTPPSMSHSSSFSHHTWICCTLDPPPLIRLNLYIIHSPGFYTQTHTACQSNLPTYTTIAPQPRLMRLCLCQTD